MAQKRMFSLQIVDTDAFLEMPVSSQLLYFHLVMRADDEGFVGNPKKTMRLVGVQEDDMKILEAKRFILSFESGVVVIKHWLIHNTIRMDRFNQTAYQDEKNTLSLNENRSYTDVATTRQPLGNQVETQVKLSEVKLSKDSKAANPLDLYQKFKANPLWEKIVAKYPDRDYEFHFQEMCDWYETKRKGLPKHISAFSNWLAKTKADPDLVLARVEANKKAMREQAREADKDRPVASRESLDRLQAMKMTIGKKI